MNDLNERLARWAGFTYSSKHSYWVSPDEKRAFTHLLNFEHSLDAQAKYLWPKLTTLQMINVVMEMIQFGGEKEHDFALAAARAIDEAVREK